MLLLVPIHLDPDDTSPVTPVPIIPDSPSGILAGAVYREPSVAPYSEGTLSGPTFTYEYVTGAELPTLRIPWADRDDFAIDFSTGYQFTLFIGHLGETAAVLKTAGIVGGVGYVDIGWDPTPGVDLNTLDPGRYDAQLRARRVVDSADRIRIGAIVIINGILG